MAHSICVQDHVRLPQMPPKKEELVHSLLQTANTFFSVHAPPHAYFWPKKNHFYIQLKGGKTTIHDQAGLVLCVLFSMVAFTPGLEMLVLYVGAFPFWFNVSVHTTITLRFGFDGKESEYMNWSCTFDMFLLSWPALSSRTLVASLVLSSIVLEIP